MTARIIEPIAFAISLVLLVLGAAGGPGWTATSGEAVIATQLEHTAASPLYHLVAGVAAYGLPVGEPGFRLAVLSALLGAIAIAGVIRAARALLPDHPIAAITGAFLLFIAPPFRDAAGFAGPAMLATAGVIWTFALAAHHAREASARTALAALACAAIVVGTAPWLGAPLLVVIALWLARTGAARGLLAAGVAAIGAVTIVLWIGAVGRMPDPKADFAAFVTASGRGSAAVVVGVGLLGVAFAVVTKLANAIWLAVVAAIVVAHTILIDREPTILLAMFAVGAAVLPAAIVRMLPARRHVVAVVASVPLAGAALLVGPAFSVDDPGDTPARLATDLLGEQPPGPGIFVATRDTTWSAIEYAQLVAGARPDLALAPPLSATHAAALVKQALHTSRIAASDVFAFGDLFPKLAFPRGRSFQLLGTLPTTLGQIRPPARYRSRLGVEESVVLALSLAQLEAGNNRLDAAAHAAGLASTRFNAADLALLSTSRPSRPPLFADIPPLGTPAGPWMLELLGDDLAWVVGLEVPEVSTPPERKLHALWRKLAAGTITPDDPAIAALGPDAVKATRALVAPK